MKARAVVNDAHDRHNAGKDRDHRAANDADAERDAGPEREPRPEVDGKQQPGDPEVGRNAGNCASQGEKVTKERDEDREEDLEPDDADAYCNGEETLLERESGLAVLG